MLEFLVFAICAILVFYILLGNNKNVKNTVANLQKKVLQQREPWKPIVDKFTTLEQITEQLRKEGLESSNLILGIDYTKSNEDQGRYTFGNKSLHSIDQYGLEPNPYQNVISIVGRTLEKFDEDRMIPAFGFGDIKTKDYEVFPFTPDPSLPRYCIGFEEVLRVYNSITPYVQLSGPTNFAPIINRAVDIVTEKGGRAEYHILVIITDGEVVNKRETEEAIVRASNYPLSIICIGVGDGPFKEMDKYDDELPERQFDNFQFVNYARVLMEAKERGIPQDVAFAVAALQEIPEQYHAIKQLGLMGAKASVQ